jgi:hypothetical protein
LLNAPEIRNRKRRRQRGIEFVRPVRHAKHRQGLCHLEEVWPFLHSRPGSNELKVSFTKFRRRRLLGLLSFQPHLRFDLPLLRLHVLGRGSLGFFKVAQPLL